MTSYTSTLPDDLHDLLKKKAKALAVPKNKLIERALRIYLNQLERAEYVRSYKRAATDRHMLDIAEEGMEDYLRQLDS